MENASKALIIAGAILLAILIISLGIVVYNQAASTVDSASLSSTEIQAFNSTFTTYEGTNQPASKVSALYQSIISNNASEVKDGTYRLINMYVTNVNVNGSEVTAETQVITVNSSTNTYNYKSITPIAANTYNITCDYDTNTGYVNKVTVTKTSTSTDD